jgi:hypothetical protein
MNVEEGPRTRSTKIFRFALLVARVIVNCRAINTCEYDAGQPWWGSARDFESHCVALLRQPYGFRLQKTTSSPRHSLI